MGVLVKGLQFARKRNQGMSVGMKRRMCWKDMETSCSVKEWAGHRPEDSCQGHSGLSGCDSSCFSFSDRTENSEQKLHRGSGMGDECCECGLTGPSPKLSSPWTSWFNIYTARGNLWIGAGSVLWCHPFLFSPDTKAFSVCSDTSHDGTLTASMDNLFRYWTIWNRKRSPILWFTIWTLSTWIKSYAV